MAQKHHIEHEGIVEECVLGHVKVRILSQSACASCHARGACSAADQKEKLIDVMSNQSYQAGQRVTLSGERKLGLIAAWWAYILPLFLVVGTLIVAQSISGDENLSGLLALVVLIPYFLILKLLQNKFVNTFSFSIKPTTPSAL